MKKILTLLFTLLIATVSYAQTYTVERVIDGDTLKLTNGERVRLIGIDTPESKPNDKAMRDSKRTGQDIKTITKMGQKATDYIKGLIGYSLPVEVRLDFDVQRKDKYGRLLAYVYSGCYCQWNNDESPCSMEEVPDHEYVILKGSKKDNVWCNFVNATMIKAGYATPMTIPPNVKYADLFKELYEEAREQGRGLWAKGIFP